MANDRFTHARRTLPSGFMEHTSSALQEVISRLSVERLLIPGEVLFEPGDTVDSFFVLIDGVLEYSLLSEDGRKLTLDIMRRGAVFGELALFDPGPYTATVTALERSTIWSVQQADMLAAMRQDPDLGKDVMGLAGKRIRRMRVQFSDQVFLPLPMRLAQKILHLATDNDPENATITHSQAELAEFIGSTRESVSKHLAVWKRDGIIDLGRGTVRILDREMLEGIAYSH